MCVEIIRGEISVSIIHTDYKVNNDCYWTVPHAKINFQKLVVF